MVVIRRIEAEGAGHTLINQGGEGCSDIEEKCEGAEGRCSKEDDVSCEEECVEWARSEVGQLEPRHFEDSTLGFSVKREEASEIAVDEVAKSAVCDVVLWSVWLQVEGSER
jgi:hypothetical protein